MFRISTTIWFTIATLLGPGWCCCSFASVPAAGGQQAPPRLRSCCQRESPPRPEQGGQNPRPAKPSKCPCEKDDQAKALPPGTDASTDLTAQLKLTDSLPVGLIGLAVFDLGAAAPGTAGTSRPPVRLAGRDLLAAYSTLRC